VQQRRKIASSGATGLAAGAILPKLGFTPAIVWTYIIGCTEFFGGLMLLGLICVAAFFRGSDALSLDRAIGREL
jgi:hypothetical protein